MIWYGLNWFDVDEQRFLFRIMLENTSKHYSIGNGPIHLMLVGLVTNWILKANTYVGKMEKE
jgi:hypothetical protein